MNLTCINLAFVQVCTPAKISREEDLRGGNDLVGSNGPANSSATPSAAGKSNATRNGNEDVMLNRPKQTSRSNLNKCAGRRLVSLNECQQKSASQALRHWTNPEGGLVVSRRMRTAGCHLSSAMH